MFHDNDNANIVSFSDYEDPWTNKDISADKVLKAALKNKLTKVVIIGYDEDDQEYMASSMTSGPEVIWLCERLKNFLINYGSN